MLFQTRHPVAFLFVLLGLATALLPKAALAEGGFSYCTLPYDPAPALPLMEVCDDTELVRSWYSARVKRGDQNLGAKNVICYPDGRGCTDKGGVIKKYLMKGDISRSTFKVRK